MRTYGPFTRPSNLLTAFEIDGLGLEHPAVRAGVLMKGSRKWDLFRACEAAPAATPWERRRIVVATRWNRECPVCFALVDRHVNKEGPILCAMCASEDQSTLEHSVLSLPKMSVAAMERPWELSAVLQLVELEARSVLERAEVAQVEERLDLVRTPVEESDLERIKIRFRGRTTYAAMIVAQVQTWREESGISQLDTVDAEILQQALKQALARLDAPDHIPHAPVLGTWPWEDLLSWLHTMCVRLYLAHGNENTSEIEAARIELNDRLAMLWWYGYARGAGTSWLVVPTTGWAVRDITRVGIP